MAMHNASSSEVPARRAISARKSLWPSALLAALFLSGCSNPPPAFYSSLAPPEITVRTTEYRHTIFFDSDRDEVANGQLASLERFLAAPGAGGLSSIRIFGHADERASDLYNLDLSARRVANVADAIGRISPRLGGLTTVALGERAPVATAHTEEAWAVNRRVEIVALAYVAEGPQCPDWSDSYTGDPFNQSRANFGCATMTNLAEMVADPKDLVATGPIGPADGMHASGAIERYRKNEVTEIQAESANQ